MPNPPIYRVKGWNDLYENNRTRDMKVMAWVPLSNRHDGDGYTDLVERKNGAGLFGAWVAVVQVASRCTPRGTLLRNGDANTAPSCGDVGTLLRRGATPHDAASLSRMTRLPKEIIQEMLDVCTNDCKWLETIESHEGAEIPQEGASIPHPTDEEGNGKKERKEEKERTESPMSDFTSLRQSLSQAYKRQDTDLWSYEEESGLSAISRRPNAKAECEELLKFKLDPDSFFPQSLQSLLSRWGETLDRARNTTAKPLSVTEKGILSKEYDRVLDKLKSLTSQYSGHQDWTVADKLERTKLRDRRDELKAKLGIEV